MTDSIPMWLFLCITIVLIVALAVMLWKNAQLNRQLNDTPASPTDDEIRRYRQQINTYKPAAAQYAHLKEGLSGAVGSSNPLLAIIRLLKEQRIYPQGMTDEDSEALLERLTYKITDADLAFHNLELIKALQDRIQAFVDNLEAQEPEGNADVLRQRCSEFIALAMMTIDVVDSIDNPNASTDRQGLNVDLMTGKLSGEEVVERAREVITEVEDSSYKWARALQIAIRQGMDLDNEHLYLMQGWRFSGHQQSVTPKQQES